MGCEFLIREEKCPVCGKQFIVPPYNVYKIKKRWEITHFCSYTCYRAEQKKIEEQRLAKKKKKDK